MARAEHLRARPRARRLLPDAGQRAGTGRRRRRPGRGRGGKILARRGLVDHYGRELEWDFAELGIDIVDFWRGRHSWAKFDSLVERFDLHSRSWLSWAKTNDVDRFRDARDAGLLTRGKPRKPETFEFGQAEQLLSGIYLLLQQVIHVTAQKGAKHPKRFRGDPWPSVATALDALETEDRERLAEANRTFMAMFEFVPQDEFEAEMAEHLAALQAGAEQSPPQQRAAAGEPAQVTQPASWGGSPSVTRGGLGAPAAPTFSDPPSPPDVGGWDGWPVQPT